VITRPKAAISGLFAEERAEAVEKTSGWIGAALVAVVLFALSHGASRPRASVAPKPGASHSKR